MVNFKQARLWQMLQKQLLTALMLSRYLQLSTRHLYNQNLDSLIFQLRFLQVLNNISEDSDVITFPLPLKTISWLTRKRRMKHKRNIQTFQSINPHSLGSSSFIVRDSGGTPLWIFFQVSNSVIVTEAGLQSDPVQYLQLLSLSGLWWERDPLIAALPNLLPNVQPSSISL